MDDNSIVSVTLKKGKKVTIVEEDSVKAHIPFIRLGVDRGAIQMDLVDIVMKLTKSEQEVIKYIKNKINYCPIEKEYVPIVQFQRSLIACTESQKKKISTAVSSLRKKNIIGKIDRYNYMINPDLLLPSNYDKYKLKWDNRL